MQFNIDEALASRDFQWIVENKLIGTKPFTQLQPWFLMERDSMFWATDVWKHDLDYRLLTFARRQDCDDLACFQINNYGKLIGIVTVHGWSNSTISVNKQYSDIWEWLKSVIDDIKEWASID